MAHEHGKTVIGVIDKVCDARRAASETGAMRPAQGSQRNLGCFGNMQLAIGLGLIEILRLISAVFNYPTLAECYKVAALDAFNKLDRAYSVEQGL